MEYWRIEHLNDKENVLGTIDSVTGGSLKWSASNAVPGTGELSFTERPELPGINWLKDRVRVIHYNDSKPTYFGTWLIANPGWKYNQKQRRSAIKLLDKCELLNHHTGRWFNIKKGSIVTTQINSIIRARASTAIQLTPSPLALSTALSWDPTATWLEILNVLLKSINYHPLWVDMLGRFRVEPYVYPGRQPLKDTYGPHPFLRMKPEFEEEAPLYEVPTGVVAYTKGDDEEPGYMARVDLPDSHPLSAASRGREILHAESVEATSLAITRELATRILNTKVGITRSASLTHPVDETSFYDVVHHEPLRYNGKIVERSVNLGIGAVVEDKIQRIYGSSELLW